MSSYGITEQRRYAGRRKILDSIKVDRGCTDCGYATHPAALDFDHRDPSTKSFDVATNWSRSWERLLAEIAKCDVRCRNCHAIRTHTVEGAHGLNRPKADPAPSLFGAVS